MLILAALLLFAVGAMHSILGGKRLIAPILRRPDLPVILGSLENTRLTLWVGWHVLTLFWWGQAVVLVVIALAPELVVTATLVTLSACAGLTGMLALVLSRAKHRSWALFLPFAFITFYAALWGPV
jgi:hypothetical protein